MQPYIFPYLGYYQLINSVDKFIVYDDVAFIKQGWINRNAILINKERHLFSIPVKGISSFRKISETEILYDMDWLKKINNSISLAYKKAPFFKDVFPIIENIFLSKKNTISELAFESIAGICSYLGLKTIFQPTSNIYSNHEFTGQSRVLDICKKESATHYHNLIGGETLYNKAEFAGQNIILNFVKSKVVSYKQFNSEFVPWLSIIDVLMFNSKEEAIKLLNEYELV